MKNDKKIIIKILNKPIIFNYIMYHYKQCFQNQTDH